LISSGGDAGLSMYSVVATKSALGCRSRRDSASSSGERPRHSSWPANVELRVFRPHLHTGEHQLWTIKRLHRWKHTFFGRGMMRQVQVMRLIWSDELKQKMFPPLGWR